MRTPSDTLIDPRSKAFAFSTIKIGANLLYLLASFLLLVVNVVTSQTFLNGMNSTHSRMLTFLFWSVAIIMITAVTMFWEDIKEHTSKWRDPRYFAALSVVCLMICASFYLNLGFVTQTMSENLGWGLSNTDVVPPDEHRNTLWWVLTAIFSGLDIGGEPLAIFLFGKYRASATQLYDQADDYDTFETRRHIAGEQL